DDEGGRGRGKAGGHPDAGQAHIAEQDQRPTPAVAPEHEPDQKGGGPDRAPKDDGPTVGRFDEARESSAEAPHEGGKKDKEVAKTFLPSRNGRLKRGGWRNSFGHGTNVCSSSARLLLQTRRPSPYSRNPRPVKLREPAPSVRWGTCRTAYWKSNALRPVTISSSPSGLVTGGSARARQPILSHSRQAGPTGVGAAPGPAILPAPWAGRAAP